MIKIIGVAVSLTAAASFAGFGDVVSSFPKPPAPPASGLAWDGSYLWFCGEPSDLFLCTDTRGSLISSFRLGIGYTYIEALTSDGEYLWYSTHMMGRPYYYHCVTKTGSGVSNFMASWPNDRGGLAWEPGQPGYLWGGSAQYTTAGSVVSTFTPQIDLGELAWYGHKLWTAISGRAYNITTKGSVVASFRLPNETGGAVTFDGSYLWLISGDWVCQIDIDVVGVDPASMGKVKALYR